jgi:hypothetical protein
LRGPFSTHEEAKADFKEHGRDILYTIDTFAIDETLETTK